MIETANNCIVEATAQILYEFWEETPINTQLKQNLARAARISRMITLGLGSLSLFKELEKTAFEIDKKNKKIGSFLKESLQNFKNDWLDHIENKKCNADICFKDRDIPPCQKSCPAHIDIPGFIAQINKGENKKALSTILSENPLSYVCGLVCPAPCEEACVRRFIDESVLIRPMKAFAAKKTLEQGKYPKIDILPDTGKKIAIIGAGPAGLTAALYLAKKGHKTVIFDENEKSGGMLRYGIPSYRLPEDILDIEIDWIKSAGVEIKEGIKIENINDLLNDFDAVFIAIGAKITRDIPIKGIDKSFVLKATNYLKDVNKGIDFEIGKNIVVIGGGNVACDVALTAIRMGAENVRMVCLEKNSEMPASKAEIKICLEDGVEIHNSWGPTEITDDKRVICKYCKKVFDESGKFNPEFDSETQNAFLFDNIIIATGQAPDISILKDEKEIKTKYGFIVADKTTLATEKKGIFAGGDAEYGPSIAVNAVRAGKQAADAIDAYLNNKDMDFFWKNPKKSAPREKSAENLDENLSKNLPEIDKKRRADLKRYKILKQEIENRKNNFLPIELSLTEKAAHNEADRCFRCDICIGCGMCALVCSEVGANALSFKKTDIFSDIFLDQGRLVFSDFKNPGDFCIGCGACESICPTGAISIIRKENIQKTVFTGTPISKARLLYCSNCGDFIETKKYIESIEKKTGEKKTENFYPLCNKCKRKLYAQKLKDTV
jgi:NADH-quinone oxidoreductase subunit F